MGWCPVCRAEYRAEIALCPKCQVSLVAQPPPPQPKDQPGVLGATALRCLARMRRIFTPSLRLGLEAFRLLERNGRLLLVALLLATLCFASPFLRAHIILVLQGTSRQEERQRLEQWRQGWPEQPLLRQWLWTANLRPDYLLGDFSDPLRNATTLLAPWGRGVLSSGFFALRPPWSNDDELSWRDRARWTVADDLFLAVGAGLDAFVGLALLGWLAAVTDKRRPGKYWGWVRSHYVALASLAICVAVTFHTLLIIAYALFEPIESWEAARLSCATRASRIVVSQAWLPLLLLALAPFAIVARGLGAWGGVKAGVSLLWRHKLTLLVLFLLYRVPLEVVNFVTLALPAPRHALLGFEDPGALFALWVIWSAKAVLGLWLAMAFFLVIREEAPSPARTRISTS